MTVRNGPPKKCELKYKIIVSRHRALSLAGPLTTDRLGISHSRC